MRGIMKANQVFLLVIGLLGFQFCWAQSDSTDVKLPLLASIPRLHYVLKVDGKSLDIGTGQLGKVKLSEINNEWVSAIEIIKGEKAIEKYGESRKDGVVIIKFKDFNDLPKELQTLFINGKKE